MQHEIKTSWVEGMELETVLQGHSLHLDASTEFGGKDKGVRSKHLMLVSLAGCTSMDVLSLLEKMRVKLSSFTVEVCAELTEEHPKTYTSTHIIYNFQGDQLDRSKIERAVELSFDTYCGVIAMFKKFSTVTKEIRYPL